LTFLRHAHDTASDVLVPEAPEAGTLVLAARDLVPGGNAVSVFGDDRWDLTPAIFEDHATAISLNWLAVPAPFRLPLKHYFWQLINHDAPVLLRNSQGPRPSIRTVNAALPRIVFFVKWLLVDGIVSCDEVTDEDLERYLDFVDDAEISHDSKEDLLHEIRRLWSYRTRLPAADRLPASPPWGGDDMVDLLGASRRRTGNKTPRVAPQVMEVLLMWALRFVQDFADDIIAAAGEERRLWASGGTSRGKSGTARAGHKTGEAQLALRAFLARLSDEDGSLPGRRTDDGTLEVNWSHLTRLLDTSANYFGADRPSRRIVQESGLPIGERIFLDVPVTGRVGRQPWKSDGIAYDEVKQLCRLLTTACFIVVSYLSGARPGEVLNLERGCISYDESARLWLMNGRLWKGATDEEGTKIPEGEERHDPWTVIELVAQAVNVLERLHDRSLLFPVLLDERRNVGGSAARRRPGQALTSSAMGEDITQFIAWINTYCDTRGLNRERIPDDPAGAICPSRFRRTLAWHIVRRPRGLVACAIQYSHVNVTVTLGYGGAYDSGFPDDHAYEQWLFRLEQLAENEERLARGEHVSGPAADTYRHRVHRANARFAGRVLTTHGQAHDLLANTELQIYPGRAMTCVFDAAKAPCQLRRSQDDTTRTPDQDDCRPNCQNIAYTDRDIVDLEAQAAELQDVVDDPLAPSIRKRRDRHELARIRKIITDHTLTR
jgi:integrase